MKNHRCICGKIVAQQEGDIILIKCRHCKRMLHIKTKGIDSIEFK